jgi:hypothetical protein
MTPRHLVQAWVEAFNQKITFQRGYWDKLSFLRLQGLPLPSV